MPDATPPAFPARIALGLSYRGGAYQGWQSQPGGQTVQDRLEAALSSFAALPVRTVCAGRTDAGVHGVNQVVHVDPPVQRDPFSWVRGCMHNGQIAEEWKTGEGKTLVAPPAYLDALTGEGVHMVTVNDYLARRDAGGWVRSTGSSV